MSITARIEISVASQKWLQTSKTIAALCRRSAKAALDVGLAHLPKRHPLRHTKTPMDVSIVLASDARVRALNSDYRGKNTPTNVLSFPSYEMGDTITPDAVILGDVIAAFETTQREAMAEDKPFRAHAAHLVVHGVLHLLGYDHMVERDARTMERLERLTLNGLGFADPYAGTVPITPRPKFKRRSPQPRSSKSTFSKQ